MSAILHLLKKKKILKMHVRIFLKESIITEKQKYADAARMDSMPVLSPGAMPLTNTRQQGATFSMNMA